MLRKLIVLTTSTAVVGCTLSEPVSSNSPKNAYDTQTSALGPQDISIEMPREHVIASGGVRTLIGRGFAREPILANAGEPPVRVFLNRFGGTYSPGPEDSRANTSIVPNVVSTIAPYGGTDQQWSQVLRCVRENFAAYNVTFSEIEPASGEYIEVAVGGLSSQVGLGPNTTGVAPVDRSDCLIIPNAIAYVFSDWYSSDPRSTCETISHEVAHTLSLDHAYYCPDVMSYLDGCGNKSFQDRAVQCGEWSSRACSCGRSAQNSADILTEKVGFPGDVRPPADTVTPSARVLSPLDGASLPGEGKITVVATAQDDVEVAATELVWAFTGRTFPCPYVGTDADVSCERTGDTSTWRIGVGTGSRSFFVRVRDTSGNVTETRSRTVTLAPPATRSVDVRGPTIEVLSPEEGAAVPGRTRVEIVARVRDDAALASVELAWLGGKQIFPCDASVPDVTCREADGLYRWSFEAGVGARSFSVRAVDTSGNVTRTSEQKLELVSTGD